MKIKKDFKICKSAKDTSLDHLQINDQHDKNSC